MRAIIAANDNLVTVSEIAKSLPTLVRRAAQRLTTATTAAEVLDAKAMAAVAYDAAKSAARFAKAKGAFDEVIKVVYNAQAKVYRTGATGHGRNRP
jgi:hypothetical protein